MTNQIVFTIGDAAQNWRINDFAGTVTGVISRSVLDTENLAYPVQAVIGGASYNPTGDVVQFAFMPQPANANPGVSDWHTGSWATTGSSIYMAQVLVGPANSGVVLTSGVYNVWIKITDNPEVPVQQIDALTIV